MPSTAAVVAASVAASVVAVGGITATVFAVASTSDRDSAAEVVKIVDGDTLDVRYSGTTHRVRLLNIDTPELGREGADSECLADEAKAFLQKRLPAGSRVTLTWDKERHDRYDRELRGVHDEHGLVNVALVRSGLAVPMHISPNYRYRSEVDEAHAAASEGKVGLFDPRRGCTFAARSERVDQAVQDGDPATAYKEAVALRALLRDPDTFASRLMGQAERTATIARLDKIVTDHRPKPAASPTKKPTPRPTTRPSPTTSSKPKPKPTPRPTTSVPAPTPPSTPTPPPAPSTTTSTPVAPPPAQTPAPRTTSAPPPTTSVPKPRPNNAAPCRSYAPGGKTFTYIDCDTGQPL